jgi:hypothetical protein
MVRYSSPGTVSMIGITMQSSTILNIELAKSRQQGFQKSQSRFRDGTTAGTQMDTADTRSLLASSVLAMYAVAGIVKAHLTAAPGAS